MKQKNYLLIFTALAFFMLIGFASSATLTLNTPSASSTLSGTGLLLNATLSANTEGYVNTTFYAKSASTANSTFTKVGFAVNNSLVSFNTTFNSAIIEDASNYIFKATANNGTDTLDSAEVSGIVIDNTVPTAPSSLSPSTTQTSDSFTISATVTGSETTACTLNFDGNNPGSSSYTMTHSGNSCSYSISGVAEQTYNYYVTASDGLNSTQSTTQTFEVDVSNAKGAGKLVNEQGKDAVGLSVANVNDGNSNIMGWIIGLIIVGLIILLVAKSK